MDIKLGSTGPLVYTIKEQLNDRYAGNNAVKPLALNGSFDKATEDRVKQFQNDWNLTPNGVVNDVTSAVLLRSTLDFEIVPRPPVMLQDTNHYHCWAAATSSWTQARASVKDISPAELLIDFRKIPGALDPDNEGLTLKGWDVLRKRYHLGFTAFGGGKGIDTDRLTIDSLYGMLKKKGHLLVAYNLPELGGTTAHVVVAFGVLIPFAKDIKPGYGLHVMDPWNGEGAGGWRKPRLEYMRTSGELLVCWQI